MTAKRNARITPQEAANACFIEHFSSRPTHTATAPGRVNLIGEHTDYNDGFVFPAAINFHTCVASSARTDREIEVVALDEGAQKVQFNIDKPPTPDTKAPWSNYVRGVVAELRAADYTLVGANLAISGNVPLGAGLSSSAALEMALIAALTRLSDESIGAAEAALIGQAAENNFVDCQCGIMDQMISAAGLPQHAMLLDCRDLLLTPALLPKNLSIVVINSNQRRALVDGEYNLRRAQCEEAAAHFGVPALRDVTLKELTSDAAGLDRTTFRRARHVISENQRTLDMHTALVHNDIQTISTLMAESHASMRDDFEITTPQIDALVEIVHAVIGHQGGVRMTGGGFGGCVVALVPKVLVDEVLQAVDSQYPAIAGHAATAFVCEAASGAFVGTPA